MKRLTLLAIVLLVPVSLRAAETTADPKDVAAKADAYMQARLKFGKFSGTVLVAKDGKPLFEKGYGLANVEHDVPNTPLTKFRLASVSKQFVATAIMILERDGKLKVEDKVCQYLPICPKSWSDVTLHQLLSHTSGVPENLRPALFKGQWPLPIDLDRLLDIVKDRPLDFKPGEKFSYSNTGYALLGMVIEKLSGKPYADFLRERIFEPLDMTDTGVDDRRLVLKHRANNYGMAKGQFVQAQYIDLSQVYAAGSLYSTVDDLLKWDNALYTEKILPRKSFERMWTPVKDNYAYGWLSHSRFDRKFINHSGGLPGCNTMVSRYPEQQVFVAVLCNLEGSPITRVSFDLAAIALGDPYDVPIDRKEVKLDPKLFDAYVGDYELKPTVTVTISKKDDALYAQFPGRGKYQIYPEVETKFFNKALEVTIAFGKADKGAAPELVLHENGRDRTAKRVLPEKIAAPAKVKEPAKEKDKAAEKP